MGRLLTPGILLLGVMFVVDAIQGNYWLQAPMLMVFLVSAASVLLFLGLIQEAYDNWKKYCIHACACG